MDDLLGSLQAVCERGQITTKGLMVIYGASRRSLKPFLLTIHDPRRMQGVIELVEDP